MRMKILSSLSLLALLVCGSTVLHAGYTYVFQGTDSSLVEFDLGFLVPRYASFSILSDDLEYCSFGGNACGGILVSSSRPDTAFGTHDFVAFGPTAALAARLPELTLTRTGAAWTLPGSAIQGRMVVYDRDPDKLFEYYFKDSTGERTFRYYTDRLITRERSFADGRSDLCGPGLPAGCESGDFMANVYGLDAVRFPGLLPYYFPQFAFSTLGIHYTDSASPDSGVLTVRSVRNPFAAEEPGGPGTGDPGTDPQPDPQPDPEPVPEPSSLVLSVIGALGIGWRLYGRRGDHARRPAAAEAP